MIRELRLLRTEAALSSLHGQLRGCRILRVRYTKTELVAVYRAPRPS